MSGSNGLSPVENLEERRKCAESPSKRKYKTAAEGWKAARERTKETGIDIAPYACASCGFIHLSKRVNGSETLTRQDGGKVVTGAMRAKASNHPTAAKVPEREFLPEEETSIRAGNTQARRKMLTAWLAERSTVTTAQVRDEFDVSNPTVRADMAAIGWQTHKRGVYARPAPAPVEKPEPAPVLVEIATPVEVAASWVTADVEMLAGFSLHDLLDVYAASGLEVRLQTRTRV